MQKLAPIAVFCYNRLYHLKLTIGSLKNNYLANQSELIIIVDGPKNLSDKNKNYQIIKYLNQVTGFKKKTIIKRKKNFGLAKSIINGVTDILKKYKKIIVVEDDIVTSPYFLSYLNLSLNKYEYFNDVMHIAGHSHLPVNSKNKQSVFFINYMNCWGWGTWKNRWDKFNKNNNKIINEFSKKDIKKFDFDGSNLFWSQINKNIQGEINTWAIYWYASIFKNKGLTCNPIKSYTRNIGTDGSGMHCTDSNYLNDNPLYSMSSMAFNKPKFSTKFNLLYKNYFNAQKQTIIRKIYNRFKNLLVKFVSKNNI